MLLVLGAFFCSFVDILLLFVIVFGCVSCGFGRLFAVGTGLNFECCLLRIVVGFSLIVWFNSVGFSLLLVD